MKLAFYPQVTRWIARHPRKGVVLWAIVAVLVSPLMTRAEPLGPSATSSRPILTLGNRAPAVAELQAALKLLGYYSGSVDSLYSEPTITAVIRFQQSASLSADGIVGPATWDRLFPAIPGAKTPTPAAPKPANPTPPTSNQPTPPPSTSFPTLRLGMKGDAVIGLQERLRAIGVFNGAVDGVFGPETQAAVKAAQEKFKLEPDGVVGPTTWGVLLRK